MFSKEKGKGFLMGVLFVLISMVFVSTVFAGNAKESLEVIYNNIKIYVDGVEQQPEEDPFIYEGTTYVPLRFVSEALDENVSWDGSDQSIYIGDVPGGEVTRMKDMTTHTYEGDSWWYQIDNGSREIFETNIGETYRNGYYWSTEGIQGKEIVKEYNLDGQYDNFTAVIAPHKDWNNREADDNIGSFRFYADGEEIHDTGPIASDITEPVEVELDLEGVLRFEVEANRTRNNGDIGLLEPEFVQE
ncbi:stalk domain-containing protein [Natranaerofaba carboxydovora]|uniref:stalk domain-containing protein n=1 Tax=Natranaerofaba carboxydovora TaxID=2742683 RepID=UPI001F12EDED|nr:stalk domain-containing protein [Natranaerofaba carboxydovora]UMZ74696.1 hypothetical protein ACONDI_02296 [Natranaerofaba carboxydovora]